MSDADRSIFRVRIGRFFKSDNEHPVGLDTDLSVRQLMRENDGYPEFVRGVLEDCLGPRAHYDDSDYSENVVCIYFLVNDGRRETG